MKSNYYATLLALLMLGNLVRAMDAQVLANEQIQEEFLAAVRRNDVPAADHLLQQGADLFLVDANDRSAINYAINLREDGNSMRQLFLDHSPQLRSSLQLQKIFIAAVERNDVQGASRLLSQGADLLLVDSHGLNALDRAANLGAAGNEMRKLFLNHNPYIEFPSQAEQLLRSAESSDEEQPEESFWSAQVSGARELLNYGASAITAAYMGLQNADLNYGADATSAVHADPGNEESYHNHNRQLLRFGNMGANSQELREHIKSPYTDINYRERPDACPFWVLLRIKRDVTPADLEIIKLHEAELRRDGKLTTFDDLLRAIVERDNEKVRNFVQTNRWNNSQTRGFDINQHDCSGLSAVRLAINFNPHCVPLLCGDPLFDANSSFVDGFTLGAMASCPLMSIRSGPWGTPILNTNANRRSPLYALQRAVKSLAEKGGTIPSDLVNMPDFQFHPQSNIIALALGIQLEAVTRRITEEVRYLFGSPAQNITRLNENIACCFFWAVDGANYIFNHEIDDDFLPIDGIYERRPGFDILRGNYINMENLSFEEFVKAQLRNDWQIDPNGINQRDALGMTPMMWAAACGNLELAQFLAEFPSLNLSIQDNFFGFTALHFAIRNGHTDMVSFLIGLSGVHRKQKTKSLRSPYQLAVGCKQNSVIEFLEHRNKLRVYAFMCFNAGMSLPPEVAERIVENLTF